MSSSLEDLKIGFIASGRMPQAMIKGILGSGESGLLIRLVLSDLHCLVTYLFRLSPSDSQSVHSHTEQNGLIVSLPVTTVCQQLDDLSNHTIIGSTK